MCPNLETPADLVTFTEKNFKACVRYFLKIHYTSDLIT